MKVSRYTSVIIVENRHTILFNALTGKFVVLKDFVIDFDFQTFVSTLPQDDPHLQKFISGGMLIADDEDEITTLKNIIKETDGNPSFFLLTVNPTMDCNFRCWYCYEGHCHGTSMSEETMNSLKLFISKKLKSPKIRRFNLSFFGGEPLLRFNQVVKPLIEFTKSECDKNNVYFDVSFTSNGSLITPKIVDFLSKYSCAFQITLDGSRETHDKTRYFQNGKGSFDVIIRNIRRLILNKISVNVRLNFTEENISDTRKLINLFQDIPDSNREYYRFDFQRVWQQRSNKQDKTEKLAEEIRSEFKANGIPVSSKSLTSVRNSCYGDKVNHILINYNGEAFGCTARDFKTENRIGILRESGDVDFDEPVFSLRSNSKFIKPLCHNCRIAPLCGGGCKQRAFEALNSPNCTYGYDEEDKDNFILDIFQQSFCENQ